MANHSLYVPLTVAPRNDTDVQAKIVYLRMEDPNPGEEALE